LPKSREAWKKTGQQEKEEDWFTAFFHEAIRTRERE
jgi:hypothetical protein